MPSGHCLDEDVADGGGFDGAGDDGAPAGIGGHLVEQFVLAAAADNVDYFDFAPEDVLEAFQRAAIGQREAVEAGADEVAARGGGLLASLAAELLDLQRDLAGGKEG